jgi:hypothetical protein
MAAHGFVSLDNPRCRGKPMRPNARFRPSSRLLRLAVTGAGTAALVAVAGGPRAADACSAEGPITALAPGEARADAATGDGLLVVGLGAPALFRDDDGSAVPLGAADATGVRFFPAAPLLEGVPYRAEAGGFIAHFSVAGGADAMPPTFAGLEAAQFILECFAPLNTDCEDPDSPVGRLMLTYTNATDDRTPATEILYRYEVYDQAAPAMPLVAFVRPGSSPFVESPAIDAYGYSFEPIDFPFVPMGRYCARIVASDLSGNEAGGDVLACGEIVTVGACDVPGSDGGVGGGDGGPAGGGDGGGGGGGGGGRGGCACAVAGVAAAPSHAFWPWAGLAGAGLAGLAFARHDRRGRRRSSGRGHR